MNKLNNLIIKLLSVDSKVIRQLTPITSLKIYTSSTEDFDPSGLFSNAIFGLQGSNERLRTFSYITLNSNILHPVIYNTLIKSNSFYKSILEGNATAVFDTKKKDFVKDPKGDTGYTFFIKHLNDLNPRNTGSKSSKDNAAFFKKYRKEAMFKHLLVIPAGWRDLEIRNERPVEDEINDLYRAVFRLSSVLEGVTVDRQYDKTLLRLTKAIHDVYDYLADVLYGKKKGLNKRFASRSVDNATRNVITALDMEPADLDSDELIHPNETVMGLFQFLKGALPKCLYVIRNGFSKQVFYNDETNYVYLTDKVTLTKQQVEVDTAFKDLWTTEAGLSSLIEDYRNEVIRSKIIEFDNKYYFGLIYLHDGVVMLLQDLSELEPYGLEKKHVRPMTFTDLFYYEVAHLTDEVIGAHKRDPVENKGSISYFKPVLHTTVKVNKCTTPDGNKTFSSFPDITSEYFNSASVNPNKLEPFGGDFDGDMITMYLAYLDESVAEGNMILNDPKYYIGVDNKVTFPASTDTAELVLAHLLG